MSYAKGCDILTERNAEAPVFPGDVDSDMAANLNRISPISRDTSQILDAVERARQCDVAIAFVGDLAGLFQTGTVGEGSDTDSLQLPGVQEQLLQQVVLPWNAFYFRRGGSLSVVLMDYFVGDSRDLEISRRHNSFTMAFLKKEAHLLAFCAKGPLLNVLNINLTTAGSSF